MTKGKKIVLGILGLIVVAIVVAVAWPRETQPTLETAVAEKGTVTQSVDFSGVVSYPQTRRAAFLMSGYLDTMKVEVGDTVKKGEVLATLRDTTGSAQLAEPQKALLTLTSPIDGVVTQIVAQPGEVVSAGMPVVVVQGPAGDFEVLAEVSENDVAKLTVGDKALVTVGALDAEFSGRVQEIAPVATNVQGAVTYAVVLSMDSANGEGKGAWNDRRAGMTADVVVMTSEVQNAVYVPRKAVITRDGQDYVRVVADNDDGYEEREVRVGLRGEENRVVIVSGVDEGEEVVVKISE